MMQAPTRERPAGQLLYTVADVVAITRISRTKLYGEIQAGRLPVVRIGRAVRITREALEEWIARLEG